MAILTSVLTAFVSGILAYAVSIKTLSEEKKKEQWNLFWSICEKIDEINKKNPNSASIDLREKKIFLYKQAKKLLDTRRIDKESFYVYFHDDLVSMCSDSYYCGKAGIAPKSFNFGNTPSNANTSSVLTKDSQFGKLLTDFSSWNDKI